MYPKAFALKSLYEWGKEGLTEEEAKNTFVFFKTYHNKSIKKFYDVHFEDAEKLKTILGIEISEKSWKRKRGGHRYLRLSMNQFLQYTNWLKTLGYDYVLIGGTNELY